jgi:hypothetical protein
MIVGYCINNVIFWCDVWSWQKWCLNLKVTIMRSPQFAREKDVGSPAMPAVK